MSMSKRKQHLVPEYRKLSKLEKKLDTLSLNPHTANPGKQLQGSGSNIT